jgi:hypothetical protein
MPQYIIEPNGVAKYLSDEERQARGFMKGDCVNSAMGNWKELTHKFGNHFDIVYIMIDRRTTTLVRLMTEKQKKEWYANGKYQGHWVIFNKKNRMYIDKSNGQSIIADEKEYLSSLNEKINTFVGVYHFNAEFLYNLQQNGKSIGQFMCNLLRHYTTRMPTHKEEVKWKKNGMKVIKEYPF